MARRDDSSGRNEKQWRFSPANFILIIGIVLMVGFGLGMRSEVILGAIAPSLNLQINKTNELNLSDVQETYYALKKNFDGKLDEEALVEGASRGLVAAAGDDYTVYMDDTEYGEFDRDLAGELVGIGAEIGLRNNQPTIIRTLKDSPAQKAGLQPGDTIVGVNDEASAQWTVDRTAKQIRGKEGTTVKVTVLRSNQTHDYTLTRASVTNPSVEARVDGAIGVMTISRFDAQTGMLTRQAANQFKSQGVQKVILDLRGNGGGYLEAAKEVADVWLNNKVIVSERRDGKVVKELKSGSDPVLEGMKTVILVNGGSASASEIVAGALHDHKAATLIGEKTFGKGSVQDVIDLRMGAKLKVTIAKWYTPNGKNIMSEGIKPDKKVDLTRDDSNSGRDPQMDSALQSLK